MPDTRIEFAKKLLADDPNLSDDDLSAALKIHDAHAQVGSEKARTWADTAADVGKGFLKGAGATVAGLGEMAANAGMLPGVQPSAFNQAMRPAAFTKAEEATTAQNTPQMVGKGLETVAELAMPVGAGAKAGMEAIPSAARAGAKFEQVMGAARHVPVDLTVPGDVALRLADIAQRGGGTNFGPPPVRQFIQWATDPNKAPMTYEVARDFASNLSKLSRKDLTAMGGPMSAKVMELSAALNKSIGQAASKVGKGREYAEAMTEYAKAKRLQGLIEDGLVGAKRAAIPAALGAGAGAYWLTNKIGSLLPGGD